MDELQVINILKGFDNETMPLSAYINNFRKRYGREVYLKCGSTRYSIGSPGWDFVIKFDKSPFTLYCAKETYNYSKATIYNIQRILLPIEKITTLDNGLRIYRQKRYSVGYEDMSKKEKEKFYKSYSQVEHSKTHKAIFASVYQETTHQWIARVTQLYGKKFMRSFEHWMEECEVNDLHKGNIGILNGKPILLDYAGYRGESGSFSQDERKILENF